MTCNKCHNQCHCGQNPCACGGHTKVEARPLNELPIDRTEQMPDYLFTVKTKINPEDGNVLYQPMLLPGNAIFPNGNQANTFTLVANNDTLEIPENGVLPAYVENTGPMNVVFPADESHPAHFLIVGRTADRVICQNCGTVQILAGHQYNIGIPYYRSNKQGEVTTDPSQTGQRLFTPVSSYQLNVEFTWS